MAPEDPLMEYTWTARRMRPMIAVYVVGVFLGFMALAHFVFHSPEAVKALLLACIGGVVPLAPGIMSRVEYRSTESGLWKRSASKEGEKEFQKVFRWDEVRGLVPTGDGFKFYKRLDEGRPLVRFYKRHLSAEYSGALRVEEEDRERVRALLDARLMLPE